MNSILPVPKAKIGGSVQPDEFFLDNRQLANENGFVKDLNLRLESEEDDWQLNINYPTEAHVDVFSREPDEWASNDVPLTGSEYLEFEFDTFENSLELKTDRLSVSQDAVLDGSLSGQELQFVLTSDTEGGQDARLTPQFSFWAKENNRLTRSPDLVLATLENNSRKLLLQDFDMRWHKRSNQRRLMLNEIEPQLFQTFVGQQSVDLNLYLLNLKSSIGSVWQKVGFKPVGHNLTFEKQVKQIDDIHAVPICGFRDEEPLVDLKVQEQPKISIRRNTEGDNVAYTIEVSKNPQDWIVQVLNKDGRIPRANGMLSFERRFHLDEAKQVAKIEHVFEISKSKFNQSPLYFAFARFQDLVQDSSDVCHVTFEDYFGTND